MPHRARITCVPACFATRCGLFAVATASALILGGAASAQPSSARIALPTPGLAHVIVNTLWDERETALVSLDTAKLEAFEVASAEQQDVSYVNSVRCSCEARKDLHPADAVIAQIPKTSVQPMFFAQVHTINARTHVPVWYVVAVVGNNAGAWKLAYVNLGGDTAAPPLGQLTGSSGYTPPITALSYARMTRLAANSVKHAMAHGKLTDSTEYGATIHTRYTLEVGKDGIFGLTLPSGDVLSCFTLHGIDTYSLPSGLQQGPTQSQWGHLLAPGIYKSITADSAAPMCVTGNGVGDATGAFRFSYDQREITTTGVRM
jgi:hypothetical protein